MSDLDDLESDEVDIGDDLDEEIDDEDLIGDGEDVVLDEADPDEISVDEVIEAEEEAGGDLDDELDRDDVEASLDEILEQRTGGGARLEPDDEGTDASVETQPEPSETEEAVPRQKGEFVCQSCFLVKKLTQLADKNKGLCLDCV